MTVRKNFLHEFYGCYECPFNSLCKKMYREDTGQSGGYTFKEVGKKCPVMFEEQYNYLDALNTLINVNGGGKVVNKSDIEYIDNCRPEIKFWKELNKWSVKFYYTDDGGYDMTWTRIFFDSKEEIINWLTEYEED